MAKLIIDLRSSFWFIPALVVFAAAALATAGIELDATLGSRVLSKYPRIFGAGAEGTRQLLSAIASSTITVAGVVFSITIVALSLTAAQYSPRVLRGFMRDRANQVVLGTFLGVYVYCLLVLRTIRGGEEAFVPGVSIVGAIVLALVGIGLLIFFIHHIATSIQVSEIAARVASETIEAIRTVYDEGGWSEDESLQALTDGLTWRSIAATETGYIQSVNHDRLIEHARAEGCAVRMLRAAGDFIVRGEPLLCVSGAADEANDATALNEAYVVNTYRDITQDPAFGVQQLVDIALKALSPGVNDTATARTCLDYLTAVLLELVTRDVREERVHAEGGRILLIARLRSVEYFIASTFEAIRRNSTDNADMTLHTLQAVERVARCAGTGACRNALAREIDSVREAVGAAGHVNGDELKLMHAVERASAALAPAAE